MSQTQYRLVDADTHVNEPPNLWVDRVPAKFRDRAPRMQRFEQGDAWVVEGAPDPINFGFNASAGLPRDQRKPWVRFDEIRKGGYDPAERLKEMDADLVDAAVFYPTPRISQLLIANPDPELHLALVQAYNDWLIDYCSHDPSRLGAIFLVPNRGIDQAVAEVDRLAGKKGVAGALIGCYPHGDKDIAEEDDKVWHAIADAGLAAHIHVGLVDQYPTDMYAPGRITAGHAAGDLRFLQAPAIMVQFLNSGVFDRVPNLKLVMGEVDAGWVPYVKEQMDNRFRRRATGPNARLTRLPSDYISEHFYYTFITDNYAIRNRHAVGIDRMMWSSDYPHGGSNWPDSWLNIDSILGDAPTADREAILHGNAQSLYHFGDGA